MIKRAGQALGFTLIEMAIVLVVIGLVISGGVVAVGPVIEQTKYAETKQRLDRIEQAIILHVIRNQCLPCPAAGAPTDLDELGRAVATTDGVYSSGCVSASDDCAIDLGVVPWVNLGLSEADITDGFGARIGYAISTTGNLERDDAMLRIAPSSYPAGNLIVKNVAGTELTSTNTGGEGAAYVMISYGKDMVYGYRSGTGSRNTTDPNSSTQQAYNNTGTPPVFATNFFVQDDLILNTAGGNYFDDVVRWRTAPFIIQLCGSNACGNPA